MKMDWIKKSAGKGICGMLVAVGAGFIALVGYEMGHTNGYHECHMDYSQGLQRIVDSVKDDSCKED